VERLRERWKDTRIMDDVADMSWKKAYGCLAGLALGDAMGMPVEFMTPEQIAAEYGRVDGLVASPSWHPHASLRPGTITDDTGQALAIASVYRDQGVITPEGVARALLEWADRSAGGLELVMGPSTGRALEALRAGADACESGRGGKTNGAAMRVAPVGVVRRGDRPAALADAVQASLPTHGTTLAISGASAVACAVAEAMRPGATLDDIVDAAIDGARRGREHGVWVWTPPVDERIRFAAHLGRESREEEATLQVLFDVVGVDLVVSESIPTAFGLVALARGDPMKAIRYACNLGGDTDTIAAIAGAVCGAWRGVDALDRALLARVETINELDLAGVARDLIEIGQEMA
jgi:ADP-ribosylglycohydrolase